MSKIYTIGYAKWTIDQVARALEQTRARLVDVRLKPFSPKPGFKKAELEERFGSAYCHEPDFGNVNYNRPSEPMRLRAPWRVVPKLEYLTMSGATPLILMCGCEDPQRCHRSKAADLVAHTYGLEVEHLAPPPDDPSQTDLFQ